MFHMHTIICLPDIIEMVKQIDSSIYWQSIDSLCGGFVMVRFIILPYCKLWEIKIWDPVKCWLYDYRYNTQDYF